MELMEMINLYVLGGCVLVGWIIKNWTNNAVVNNKLIPTILCFIGGVCYWLTYQDLQMIVVGGFVGIGATGCYELVNNWIKIVKDFLSKKLGE